MSTPSPFVPLRTKATEQYPDLAPVRAAVRRGDWNAVATYVEGLPARSDRSTAVYVVAHTAGSERFLQRVVDTERDSSLARTLLGARLIITGWEARGSGWAKHVKAAQWRVFHDHLGRAERLLADATAIDPSNAAAWTQRVTVARGLSLGQDEARRRYERAAEHCDVPYAAQVELVQTLCPKWGGSVEAVFAFARQCLEEAKPGSLGGAVVADAYTEIGFADYGAGELSRYFTTPRVRDELVAAAAHTVAHPDFQPVHGWVGAHSVFAFVLFHARAYDHAAAHFAALGNRVNSFPWSRHDSGWKSEYRRAFRRVASR